MPEDQLTRQERLRLEAFAQAANVAPLVCTQKPTLEFLFRQAREIETFLLAANTEHARN